MDNASMCTSTHTRLLANMSDRGVTSVLILLPLRFMHNEDVENVIKLISELLQ